jgi:hypothetical protein
MEGRLTYQNAESTHLSAVMPLLVPEDAMLTCYSGFIEIKVRSTSLEVSPYSSFEHQIHFMIR